MYNLIVKSQKIVETEIYSNRIIYFLTNVCVLLLIVLLLFGDITNRATGNSSAIFWIAMNVSLAFNVYLRNNREHILCIGKLGDWERYRFLILFNVVRNLPWMFVLFLQLLLAFEAKLPNAAVITFVQFVYAVSLGAICGTIKDKRIGCMIIGAYWLYSFIICNPYHYYASSHVLCVSEPAFTVNKLNMESITSLFICSLLFLTLSYLKVKMDIGKNVKAVIAVVLFAVVYSVFLQNALYRYNKGDAAEYKTYADNTRFEYKGLSDSQIADAVNVVDMMESGFSGVLGEDHEYDKIYINKQFLPKILWMVKREDKKPFEVKDKNININVMAPSMLYFENSDFLKDFMQEVGLEMEANVPNYDISRFSRHVIEGYKMGILESVSGKLNIESAKEAHDYYVKDYSEMLECPVTEYNYTKRIAYIVCTKYPECTKRLYSDICEKEISTDAEFVDLLKNEFTEVYNDPKVADILDIFDA